MNFLARLTIRIVAAYILFQNAENMVATGNYESNYILIPLMIFVLVDVFFGKD